MSGLAKRSIVLLTAGAVILAGAVSPFAVQAAADNEYAGRPPAMYQRHFDPDKFAQRIADTYGVSKDEVIKYNNQGIRFGDVSRASFLAKASGKSLKEVMEAKTYDNSWREVAQSLGVTKEQMKVTRNDIAATRLESKLQISKQTSLGLLNQGYHSRDIAAANALSGNTGTPISDVLGMKKINNSWHDVATALGVDDSTFMQDMKNIRTAFPHAGFHGPRHAPMM